ncbi:MAG: hypothetical protein QM703_16695 [Gemmatales bacterium]
MSQTIGAVVGQMQQGRTDVALLTDFVVRQDAEAFTHLVERHAGLVWSVCKRIIHRHQSAEDAFQATCGADAEGSPAATAWSTE